MNKLLQLLGLKPKPRYFYVTYITPKKAGWVQVNSSDGQLPPKHKLCAEIIKVYKYDCAPEEVVILGSISFKTLKAYMDFTADAPQNEETSNVN